MRRVHIEMCRLKTETRDIRWKTALKRKKNEVRIMDTITYTYLQNKLKERVGGAVDESEKSW